ncbi:LexA family protein [Microbacterium sp. NPDC055988]|uniref:LexA family protein n=1 Tax=Microbacterium sp. NPDC055988 TaxID=3345671 RepID=UPI0035D90CAA
MVAPIAVACGFPSPAQDYYDGPIDLTDMLVDDQAATFIVRASGHSMTGAGISDGDELLVDRSKRAQHGDIIVAVLDGELTVKRLEVTRTGVVLRSENTEHPDIVVAELSDLQVWGVATYCIHHLR